MKVKNCLTYKQAQSMIDAMNIPAQDPELQDCTSVASPRPCWMQFGPPLAGLGFVQNLVRNRLPAPHETEHDPH